MDKKFGRSLPQTTTKNKAAGDIPEPRKTRRQLLQDLERLRRRIEELEKLASGTLRLKTELNHRERRFQNILDTVNVGLYRNTAGPKGRFVEVNPALMKIFGYEFKEELLKVNVSDFYRHPSERRRFSEKMKAQGFVRNEQLELKKRDGTPIFCTVSAIAVEDAKGRVRYFDGIIEDRTDQIKAEEALRRSESKFRNIVEASPMGIHLYELDADQRLVFVGANPAADKILNVDNSRFIGKSIEEAFPPLADTEIPRRYREAAVQGKSWHADQVLYEDNKIEGAYEVYAFQTSPGRMAAMFLDITERKQAEEALKESEECYLSLFERSLYAVFIHDFTGRFLDANQAALDLLGYTRRDIPLLSFPDILESEFLDKAYAGVQQILEIGHQPRPAEYRLKTKNGQQVWVEAEATLLYRRGEPYAVQGIARNITEYKQTEAALRESEVKYRAIFESFHDVYYRTDREGHVTIISPSVRTQAGYAPEDVIGHPVTDFYLNPDERQNFNQSLKEQGMVNDYELQLLAKDGRVIEVSASSKLIFDASGNPEGVEGVLRDITDRKNAEECLKASLKEKEVLLQEIHHRVKNNMQIISSLLNLQSQRVKNADAKEMLHESRDRIRAMALIHEKLYQSQNLAKVNLGQYIDSLTVHLYHIYAADSMDIRLDLRTNDVFLDINTAIPCGLIINELVSNALKHAFPDGHHGFIRLEVSTGCDGRRCLIVKDNGVGLPAGFDIHKPQTLGMQLVKDLAAQIGGSIRVDTRGGTCFTITF